MLDGETIGHEQRQIMERRYEERRYKLISRLRKVDSYQIVLVYSNTDPISRSEIDHYTIAEMYLRTDFEGFHR